MKVTKSIGQVKELFQDLNQIVNDQGDNLINFSDNILDAKDNTGDTVIELK